MKNWLRMAATICLAGFMLAGCNDLPKPEEKKPAPEPEPQLTTQWFWQPAVWETTGPVHQWFRDVITSNTWILKAASQVQYALRLNIGPDYTSTTYDWAHATQGWNSTTGLLTVNVPFNGGATSVNVVMRPTYFILGAHTVDIVRAEALFVRKLPDTRLGAVLSGNLIGLNQDGTLGLVTTYNMSKLASGQIQVQSIISSKGASSALYIQKISEPTLGPTSIIVTPAPPGGTPLLCTASVVIGTTPPNTSDCTSPNTFTSGIGGIDCTALWESYISAGKDFDRKSGDELLSWLSLGACAYGATQGPVGIILVIAACPKVARDLAKEHTVTEEARVKTIDAFNRLKAAGCLKQGAFRYQQTRKVAGRRLPKNLRIAIQG